MKKIDIRDLNSLLGQILREISSGDGYLVTDRGRVVGELRRPGTSSPALSAEERALTRLAAEGHLRIAQRPAFSYERSPVRAAKGTARRLIDAERGV